MSSVSDGIFISYRREDSAHFAGRLVDSISAAIPTARVFIDVDSIKLGEDFVDVLNEHLNTCKAMLLVIGPKWLGSEDKNRLDDPDDFIRLEIETAIARKIAIIPILVDGAQMPSDRGMPASLRPIRRRQFIRIDHANYGPIVRSLISQLDRLVAADRPRPAQTAVAQGAKPQDRPAAASRSAEPETGEARILGVAPRVLVVGQDESRQTAESNVAVDAVKSEPVVMQVIALLACVAISVLAFVEVFGLRTGQPAGNGMIVTALFFLGLGLIVLGMLKRSNLSRQF